MYTTRREYDCYGNLVLDMAVKQWIVYMDSREFEHYKDFFLYTVIDNEKVIMMDGHIDEYRYDRYNNKIEAITTWYRSASNVGNEMIYKRETAKTQYKYIETNKILESIETVSSEFINLCTSEVSSDGEMGVVKKMNSYDEYGNIHEIKTLYAKLENVNVEEVNFDDIDYEEYLNRDKYTNSYDDKGRLIEVEMGGRLTIYSYRGDGKVKEQKVYCEDELINTVKLYHDENGFLYRKVFYVNDFISREFRYKLLNGRIAEEFISPVNDSKRWWIDGIGEDGCLYIEVKEAILTHTLLLEIVDFTLNKVGMNRLNLYVYLVDTTTFHKEIQTIVDRCKNILEIEFHDMP